MLDFTTNPTAFVPADLDFGVTYEPTRVADKKYVINEVTGDPLGIVGHTFRCASHPDFYNGVNECITEHLSPAELEGKDVRWNVARGGAWAMMDMTLPNVTSKIATDKHETTVAQRIIALHGIDGSCSNQVFFGAIDFFCTNGMVRGEHDKVRRKNSSGFTLSSFIRQLEASTQSFYQQSKQLQHWAKTRTTPYDVKAMLDSLMSNERQAEKMFNLYNHEAAVRGHNKWSLYSAMTNYASYADERNGFTMRKTSLDNEAITMFKREQDVAGWVSSKQFSELVAA
jgi:hypothetical protein